MKEPKKTGSRKAAPKKPAAERARDRKARTVAKKTEERRNALWDKGLETRRAVVGEDYVERSLAAMDGFNDGLQDFITRYAWGDIWNRPGLSRRDRSLLNIGMLVALGKEAELKLHLMGAIRNGVTKDEIKECILQAAIYCGAPAALEATRVARAAFAEMAE